MKKALALLLALAMSCTMLTACSEDSSSDKDSSSAPGGNTPKPVKPSISTTDSSEPDSSTPDSSEPDSSVPDSSEPDSPVTHDVTLTGHSISFGDKVDSKGSVTISLFDTVKNNDKIAFESVDAANNVTITCYVSGTSSYTVYSGNNTSVAIINQHDFNNTYFIDETNSTYYEFPGENDFSVLGELNVLKTYQEIPDLTNAYVETVEVVLDGENYCAEYFNLNGEEMYFIYDTSMTKILTIISENELANEIGASTIYASYVEPSYDIPSGYAETTLEGAQARFAEVFNMEAPSVDPPATDSRYDDLKAIVESGNFGLAQYIELGTDIYAYTYFTTDGTSNYYYIEYPDETESSILETSDGIYLFDEEAETYTDGSSELPDVKKYIDEALAYFDGTFVEETEVTIEEDGVYSADEVKLSNGDIIYVVYGDDDAYKGVLIDDSDSDSLVTLPGLVETTADTDYLEVPSWFTEK